MAYNITLTNSAALITGGLPDGTIDNFSTSLTLVGKNYPGYGIFLNQNMVRMLENFANSSAPTAPLPGQLWWDTSSKYLKVNVATAKGTASQVFKTIVPMTPNSSAPSSPVTGEQWWDTVNAQLKVWTGSAWTVVGPATTSSTGNSGAIPDIITDTLSVQHIVLKFYIDNTLVGVWSKDQTSFNTLVTGFSTIYPGINLNTSITQTFYGNAYTALNMVVGGTTIPSSSFARKDSSPTFTVPIVVESDSGITVGAASNFTTTVSSGTVTLRNTAVNANLIVNLNKAGIQSTIFMANAASGLLEAGSDISSTSPSLSYATKNYVDVKLGGGTGTSYLSASLVPTANLTYDLGSSSVWWNNIYGTAIHAQYADLAERFETDKPYSPGTVVELGGEKEITAAVSELSEEVFGVISTRAAYLMNSRAGTDQTHPPVAVQGRVPVRVIGPVRKGDRLVAAGNGLARSAARNEMNPWNVIGRSLETKTSTGEGTIEAIVQLNS